MNNGEKGPMVVVGVDGSEPSVEALREAEKLAAPMGLHVQALTCWNQPSIYEAPYGLGGINYKKSAQKVLDRAVEAAFGIDWPDNLSTRLVRGDARETLIEASRDASLLVVGRRGMGKFKGLLMGSVSGACAAHAHCPVVIVHAPKTGEHHV